MFYYMIKIATRQYKADEFVEGVLSVLSKIRKEKGCVGCKVYRDSEKRNAYILVGEWNTRRAMERHFRARNFEVLIGAARVLGEAFEMNIAEVFETGGFELTEAQIALQ